MSEPLVVAHRGASADFRENTIEAFRKAVEFGADMVELDVQQTADSVLATFHNSTIHGHKISELTFVQAQELAKKENFVIPTLEESLRYIAGKLPVQIELKGLGYEQQAAGAALKILKPKDFYIISFKFASLKRVKQLYPQIKTALILGSSPVGIWKSRWYVWGMRRLLPYLDAVSLNWGLWQQSWAQKLPNQIKVFIWTVDDMEVLKAIFKDPRIAGVASNKVRQAVAVKNQIL